MRRCSLSLKSWLTLAHLQMWIQSQLKNIQMEQWHHADISTESKLSFSTAIYHTLQSSVFPSLTAFKQYQTSLLELFLATLYSGEDSSLDEIQHAESLISCSWSQKFLFDVAFSKKKKKHNFWRKDICSFMSPSTKTSSFLKSYHYNHFLRKSSRC